MCQGPNELAKRDTITINLKTLINYSILQSFVLKNVVLDYSVWESFNAIYKMLSSIKIGTLVTIYEKMSSLMLRTSMFMSSISESNKD